MDDCALTYTTKLQQVLSAPIPGAVALLDQTEQVADVAFKLQRQMTQPFLQQQDASQTRCIMTPGSKLIMLLNQGAEVQLSEARRRK